MNIADMQEARAAVAALRLFFEQLRDDDDVGEEGMTTREVVAALRITSALEVLMTER